MATTVVNEAALAQIQSPYYKRWSQSFTVAKTGGVSILFIPYAVGYNPLSILLEDAADISVEVSLSDPTIIIDNEAYDGGLWAPLPTGQQFQSVMAPVTALKFTNANATTDRKVEVLL